MKHTYLIDSMFGVKKVTRKEWLQEVALNKELGHRYFTRTTIARNGTKRFWLYQ